MTEKKTLSTEVKGPIRAEIIAQNQALSLFSRKEQNNIIRGSLTVMAAFFIKVFLPKRFTQYAEQYLRYNPRASWEAFKQIMVGKKITYRLSTGIVQSPQPMPLVLTGNMRKSVLSGARPDARSTANKAVAIIKLPLGHPVRPETAAVLRTVPAVEFKRLAEVFKGALIAGIAKGFTAGNAVPRGIPPPARQIG